MKVSRTPTYGWVDTGESVGQGLDSTVASSAAVPVLWPALWHILELASNLVELSTDDARDRLIVGNTTGSISAVAEVFGIEVEGDDRDDGREGKVVQPWVVLLGEARVGAGILARSGVRCQERHMVLSGWEHPATLR